MIQQRKGKWTRAASRSQTCPQVGDPGEGQAWEGQGQLYEATWPQQPQTDLQLNYTNTDPHGRKEISISCENRPTANHPLSSLFARLPSQQVANCHLVAILSIQLTITPRIPLLAEEGSDPKGGWTPRKGREYLWTPSHLREVSVGLLPMVVFIVIKRK